MVNAILWAAIAVGGVSDLYMTGRLIGHSFHRADVTHNPTENPVSPRLKAENSVSCTILFVTHQHNVLRTVVERHQGGTETGFTDSQIITGHFPSRMNVWSV